MRDKTGRPGSTDLGGMNFHDLERRSLPVAHLNLDTVREFISTGDMPAAGLSLAVLKALFDAQTILAAVTDNTPAAVTIAEQQIVGRLTGGNIKGLTVAEAQTLLDIITKTLFDANTILKADSDNTPAALVVGEQSVVGRITAGVVAALTGTQLWTILTGQAAAAVSMNGQNLTNLGTLTGAASNWWREFHASGSSANPGASGPTFVPADANSLGGYQLNAVGELLQLEYHVHEDWDGASDLIFNVDFEVNVDNSGGGAGDTVDLQAVFRYKGNAETAIKSQTVEVATVVGQSPQYKRFTASFTIDYDYLANVVEVGDVISIVLNLETDTSEVDDIIINHIEFKYKTATPAPNV